MTRSSSLPVLALASLLAGAPLGAQAACAGLKSGSYVAMNPQESDLAWRVNLLTVDATALTVTDREGSVSLVPTADRCRYTLDSATGPELVFSKRGVFLVRLTAEAPNGSGSVNQLAVGMPLTAVTVRQMAGAWNFMRHEYSAEDARWHTYNGVAELTSAGVLKVAACNAQGADCAAPERIGVLSAHPEGGFVLNQRDGSTGRFFGMKNGADARMMMGVSMSDGAITVLAPVAPRALPTVGDTWANWDVTLSAQGVPGPVTTSSYRVMSVDAAAGTFRRKRLEDCVLQTWAINTGRAGVQHRPAGAARNCEDQRVTFGNNLAMPLTEAYGFSAYGWEAQDATQSSFFGLSIRRP